jgi:metal-responsive CopG/Arc/MetJ family transcriptional regulator
MAQTMTVQSHTIKISGIPDDLLRRLDEKAKEHGSDRNGYIREIIEEKLKLERTPSPDMTFAEILAPIHEYSRKMGYTDKELKEFALAEVAAYRAEKRAKRG